MAAMIPMRGLQVAVLLSYFVLTIVLNLLGRYHRSGPSTFNGAVYVVITEVLKMAICVIQSLRYFGTAKLQSTILDRDMFKYALPAAAYAVQKNLDLASIARLEVPFYLLVVEGKSVLAAVWSCALLNRRFSLLELCALIVLVFGDALALGVFDGLLHGQPGRQYDTTTDEGQRFVVGTICGLLGTALSSFASVYSELLLKRPGSMWVRNVQFGCFAIPVALGVPLINGDLEWIRAHGMLHGFSASVWTMGVLNAAFGLVMAACLKYVSAVAIGFNRSSGLVVLTVLSIPLFGFKPNASFLVGSLLVLSSTIVFTVSSSRAWGSTSGIRAPSSLPAHDVLAARQCTDTELEVASLLQKPPLLASEVGGR